VYCGAVPWQEWRSGGFLFAVMPDSLRDGVALAQSFSEISDSLKLGQERGYVGGELT
jgi:hypothetical protein